MLSIHPNGRTLASADKNGNVKIWNIGDGALISTLNTDDHHPHYLAFTPDGSKLASGGWAQKNLFLWDTRDWKGSRLGVRPGCMESAVNGLEISRDGKILAVVTGNGDILLWDIRRGQALAPWPVTSHSCRHILLTPDGRTLVCGQTDNEIVLWTVDGRHSRTLKGHADSIVSLSVSADGKLLASGSARPGWDTTIRLWRLPDGSHLRTLSGHENAIEWLAFTPDAEQLVSGSADQTVRVWRANDGRAVHVLKGTGFLRSMTVDPGGKWVAGGSSDGSLASGVS
jgi:WD40 repeat protein